jgi:hypothetical protein
MFHTQFLAAVALRRLHLGFNELTGGIPAQLVQLSAVQCHPCRRCCSETQSTKFRWRAACGECCISTTSLPPHAEWQRCLWWLSGWGKTTGWSCQSGLCTLTMSMAWTRVEEALEAREGAGADERQSVKMPRVAAAIRSCA